MPRGVIIEYSVQQNAGIISGQDGARYYFQGDQWKVQDSFPTKGMSVDFIPNEQWAFEIYLIQNPSPAKDRDCNKMAAGLFAIFLGCLGVHKFYMGNQTMGIIYLLASVFGLIACGVPTMVIGVISIIEGIIYLGMTQDEFHVKYILSQSQSITKPPTLSN